jgi:membrane-bound serine protease (ClpP class)
MLVLSPLTGTERVIGWIRIEGTINPATANYIERAAGISGEAGQECLVIQLDTPGGLLDSTQDIVKCFYATPVPIVVYVAPSGANAGSAGCFITLAGDVAVMAPNTSIGAAHPVMMGPGNEDDEAGQTMNQKLENFAASYIEAIADKRKRNAEWAISAVRESASITAEKALELGVIDLIARDRIRGHVHPHAGGHIRDHRGTECSGDDSAWSHRADCLDPGPLHGRHPTG